MLLRTKYSAWLQGTSTTIESHSFTTLKGSHLQQAITSIILRWHPLSKVPSIHIMQMFWMYFEFNLMILYNQKIALYIPSQYFFRVFIKQFGYCQISNFVLKANDVFMKFSFCIEDHWWDVLRAQSWYLARITGYSGWLWEVDSVTQVDLMQWTLITSQNTTSITQWLNQ